ncbi:MAG: permease [Planctomycetota bacterium]
MNRTEWKKLALMVIVVMACMILPLGSERFRLAAGEAIALVGEYARSRVLLALVPALFIAGGIATFLSRAGVLKYLGARANRWVSYGVASVSGSVMSACSCTVLPVFAGIRRMGAGLGPACTFLYAGPAINVLAVVLTAERLGWQLGLARAIGAVVFSVVIGATMHLLFLRSERKEAVHVEPALPQDAKQRPAWKTASLFAVMVAALLLANWARSGDARAVFLCCPEGLSTFEATIVEKHPERGTYTVRDASGTREVPADRFVRRKEASGATVSEHLYDVKWLLTAGALLVLLWMLHSWVPPSELLDWTHNTWDLAKQIVPLLLIGVLVAGFLLGRPGHDGLIPGYYIQMLVGDNPAVLLETTGFAGSAWESAIRAGWGVWTNLFAALAGSLMYFATLTEVPIVQGLRYAGMGPGPALALLLAGPAVSLPNVLVIRSVMGTRKTLVYCLLVVTMATISGMIYQSIVGAGV